MKTDTREVPLPPEYEHLAEKGFKAVKFGHNAYLEGPGYGLPISNEIREKINNEESVVIVCSGGPGVGKTYFGIRYAQALDPDFHITDTPPPPPEEDTGQLVFSREHLAYLTGPNTPLKRGQALVIDESHFGVGSRSWQNRDQQEIVNYLAAIRSKGFVLILIVLHTRMIDVLLRDFVINFEFYLTDRGIATCYRRFFPQFSNEPFKRKLGIMELPLPDEEYCNWLSCLKCKNLRAREDVRCETIRAIYERRKEFFLVEKGQKTEEERKTRRTKSEWAEKLYTEKLDMLYLNNVDDIDIASIKEALEGLGGPYGDHSARSIRSTLKSKYPTVLNEIPKRNP